MARTLMMLISAFALLAAGACSSRSVVDESTREAEVIRDTEKFDIVELQVSFTPLADWEITDEEWRLWVAGWSVDYQKEMNSECHKMLNHIDTAAKPGNTYVTCDIYEMDKGGSFGVGGSGFARANVKIVDIKSGAVLYEAKLEGKGSSGVFETATAQGRFKFSVLSLARQISDLLETGSARDPD
jgi:hypothetical protein